MRNYFVKTPWWLKRLYPDRVWQMDTKEKLIYLTFDDGPHPEATPFVLDELKKYNAQATFFCLGKNVEAYPEIYRRILKENHRAGNHTCHHLNGWKTPIEEYVSDVLKASAYIQSDLFRPPYGKVRSGQVKELQQVFPVKPLRVIMWDVLSGDFDQDSSKEKCLRNVTEYTTAGSIVVFHDNEKSMKKLEYILPRVLQFFTEKNYSFASVS